MYFPSTASLAQIQSWLVAQYSATQPIAKHGFDVELRPHRRQRSNEQNRFLMAIMVAVVRFYNTTGFMPYGCSAWMMRTDILKEYFKARFGVVSTAKLDTRAFGEFIDNIQRSLVEESGGEWEILEPDSAYLRALVEQGGM